MTFMRSRMTNVIVWLSLRRVNRARLIGNLISLMIRDDAVARIASLEDNKTLHLFLKT